VVIIAVSGVVEGHGASLERVKKGRKSCDNHHNGERYETGPLMSRIGEHECQRLPYIIPPSNLKKEQQATACEKN